MGKRQKYLEPGLKIEVRISEIVSVFLCLFLATYLSLFLAFIIRFDDFLVSGTSMEDNYVTGDYVYADKFLDIKHGDVVVIYEKTLDGKVDSEGKPVNPYILKRVVGLPYDTVKIVSALGEYRIEVNNVIEREWYLTKPWTTNYGINNNVTLGAGEYYVLGDNRNDSKDSRDSEIGIKTADEIVGVVIMKVDKDKGFFEHVAKRFDLMFNLEFWLS